MTLDAIDHQILTLLQENARHSNAEIARRVGYAPSAVFQRIRKLEAAGIIRGYHADLDPDALGVPLLAFIHLRGGRDGAAVSLDDELAGWPEILEVHRITGPSSHLLKVRCAGAKELMSLVDTRLARLPGAEVLSVTSVLATTKSGSGLPENVLGEPPA